MSNWRRDMERVAGFEPLGCPWRAFFDPLVAAVLEAVRACSGGMGVTPALLIPMDLPHAVWQGVLLFVQTKNIVTEHDRKQEEKRRESERKSKR